MTTSVDDADDEDLTAFFYTSNDAFPDSDLRPLERLAPQALGWISCRLPRTFFRHCLFALMRRNPATPGLLFYLISNTCLLSKGALERASAINTSGSARGGQSVSWSWLSHSLGRLYSLLDSNLEVASAGERSLEQARSPFSSYQSPDGLCSTRNADVANNWPDNANYYESRRWKGKTALAEDPKHHFENQGAYDGDDDSVSEESWAKETVTKIYDRGSSRKIPQRNYEDGSSSSSPQGQQFNYVHESKFGGRFSERRTWLARVMGVNSNSESSRKFMQQIWIGEPISHGDKMLDTTLLEKHEAQKIQTSSEFIHSITTKAQAITESLRLRSAEHELESGLGSSKNIFKHENKRMNRKLISYANLLQKISYSKIQEPSHMSPDSFTGSPSLTKQKNGFKKTFSTIEQMVVKRRGYKLNNKMISRTIFNGLKECLENIWDPSLEQAFFSNRVQLSRIIYMMIEFLSEFSPISIEEKKAFLSSKVLEGIAAHAFHLFNEHKGQVFSAKMKTLEIDFYLDKFKQNYLKNFFNGIEVHYTLSIHLQILVAMNQVFQKEFFSSSSTKTVLSDNFLNLERFWDSSKQPEVFDSPLTHQFLREIQQTSRLRLQSMPQNSEESNEVEFSLNFHILTFLRRLDESKNRISLWASQKDKSDTLFEMELVNIALLVRYFIKSLPKNFENEAQFSQELNRLIKAYVSAFGGPTYIDWNKGRFRKNSQARKYFEEAESFFEKYHNLIEIHD
ncbi:hypothetical protein O181_064699 [Austropuccinia psidii MF-1]|uniref:Uncharacterized protein n=1 Tax=Austropuccinia psidii MF-1 TaxID=1389203 RepID=A0A9Q3EPM5_9BASI|nr:hypothetical protein [Austropuccinia psidii MF-1]